MAYDNKTLDAKKVELEQLGKISVGIFSQAPPEVSKSVVSAFVRLTPPIEAEPPPLELITLGSSGTRGTSRKPGNIFLNWRRLLDIAPDVTIAAAGTSVAPFWLQFAIALYIWNKLWCGAKEDLSDAEATVIFALWKNRDEHERIEEIEGYEKTNSLRRVAGLGDLSKAEYGAAINRLIRMECIEMNEGVIWLREWVRVSYH